MAGLRQGVSREDFEAGLKNNDLEPETLKPTDSCEQILAQSDVFDLRKVCLSEGEELSFEAGGPYILSVVSGELTADDGASLKSGDNTLLPASQEFHYTANTVIEVLITENFTR
jgi:mannose-6-phosphate isomerase class I